METRTFDPDHESSEDQGRLRRFYEFTKTAVQEYIDDNGSDMAASLAFFAVFSLAPLLLIATAVAGFVFGEQAVEGELAVQIEAAVGPEAAQVIQTMIQQAADIGTGIVAVIIGVAALIWGGLKVFMALQRNLDDIWEVDESDDDWRQSVRDKLRSAVMILGAGIFLIALLLISVVVTAFARIAGDVIPTHPVLWEFLNLGLVFLLLTGVFGVLFRFLPRANPPWSNVWVGAAITAAFFVLGRWAVGLYLTETSTASIFGAAGAIAIVLLWMYYMAQIFFFGAEITKVYTRRQHI